MLNDNDILGRPRTTVHWVVFSKDYRPGDWYYTYRFKKDAVGKAKALGNGTEIYKKMVQLSKDGSYLMSMDWFGVYVGWPEK